MPERLVSRVALVGWDGADWKVINPLLDAGKMPHLQELIERGVMGNIRTLTPVVSPMLWTSIATGKTADQHGILGFVEPDPVTGGVRPVASTSRKVKAVWNILNQCGSRPAVINWFPSHPAEPVDGIYVSEAFRRPAAPHGKPWPLPPRSVHPQRLEQALTALRAHPGDLTGDDMLPFVPELARIDQEKDHRLIALALLLAENITVHAAATWAMENEPWDFLAVYYDAIDHASHGFMKYRAPRMEQVSEDDFALYRHVIEGIYRFQDMMLGRIVELAGPDAAVIVVSDHGFHNDELRPVAEAEPTTETPLTWHRSHGIICMAGPGIRRDQLIHGATLLDVAPTALALFGQPSGADMPGRDLAEAFDKPVERERIPSWEEVPGESGMHVAAPDQDPWDASAAIEQLAALGYVEPPSEDRRKQVHEARQQQNFNLARVQLAGGLPAGAIPLLEDLVRERTETSLKMYLAQACFQAGRLDACRDAIELVLREDGDRPVANVLMGNLCLAEGKTEEGIRYLETAAEMKRPMPALRSLIGRAYLSLKRWSEAERMFRSALELDPDAPEPQAGLAQVLIEMGRLEEAAEAALAATGLKYDLPAAHYFLGVALAGMSRTAHAIRAFDTCLALRPEAAQAHEWLASIYARSGDSKRAAEHRRQAHEVDMAPPQAGPVPVVR